MNEFTHYANHTEHNKDMDNCGACALLFSGSEGPNYAGWPLAFIQCGRSIPFKYRHALAKELQRTDNPAYVDNLKSKLDSIGFQWRGLIS